MELHQLLTIQLHRFSNYAMSFLLLAIFWIVHHQQFCVIKRTNRTHLWINVFILMFIALVPFSSSLAGDYETQTFAHLFFSGNLFLIGFLFYINWIYATTNYRLIDRTISPARIEIGTKRSLVLPGVSLCAIVLSIYIPPWSSVVYLSVPLILSRFKN